LYRSCGGLFADFAEIFVHGPTPRPLLESVERAGQMVHGGNADFGTLLDEAIS